MKKFIIILLLILPIFLMVTISFAGRIFSNFVYIDVERVEIVNERSEEIEIIKLGKGEKKKIFIKVYPDLASNKSVEYLSLDEEVVTIVDGEIEGINYGFATILVKSVDGQLSDKVTVNVTDEKVERIDIDLDSKSLYLYQSYTLTTTIYPSTALDKKVYWESSNPEYVSVDANGKITALKITENDMVIEITATTRDGEKVDCCLVTVVPYLLAFKPQIENNASTYTSKNAYIDLMDFIVYDDSKIAQEDICFEIVSGSFAGEIIDNQLIFNESYEGQPIKLKVYVDTDTITIESQIFVRFVSE